ncbi:aminopeptidase P N-terminal domain-containing protein [Cuneatibacter sp. NSJ-177]|uniref:aminopeptidase P N-terminal domain-containing protein n=1 Tax=Cuneatibacter sp. NSJ-177 TaxID=2931401 RepID=UPI001FD14507|nr:aminopeptidase P N-terminal domain-containing protein [Cuneatibacter sp. NSJ-177]MCJ7836588.1 aminopeptidase P N-terminal domain-containing protein [Cuneatibacter sp. NSJ-177]
MNAECFTANRRRFFDRMEDCSAAVFFSGHYRRDTNDQLAYPFSVDRNFYYFTGIDRDGFLLILWKYGSQTTAQLFIPPVDAHYEKWQARMLRLKEAAEISGIGQVLYRYQFEEEFAKKMFSPGICKNVYLFTNIAEMHEPLTPSQVFARRVSALYPSVQILNSLPLMTELRNPKSPEEIEEITRAVNLTGGAIEHVAGLLHPGMWEYQVKAHYIHYLSLQGSGPRFRSVIAAGKNATVLHYNEAKDPCADGDMVLMDVGAVSNWYVSDVTRTLPVNGKFTEKQRIVYDIVYEALEIALGTIRVGISENEVNAAVKKHYGTALKAIGLIDDPQEVERYYFHGSGHPIGLDLHDLRDAEKTVTDGCVHTVEPGLYIAEWGMGIRIEDNVLVTASGVKNLSDHIPKKANDIENMMK